MRTLVCIIPLLFLCMVGCRQEANTPDWPSITSQQKPWTRWWWQGSAVTKNGITAELEAFAKAGLGGVEITPIYGVHGAEEQFVRYLSLEWIELLVHTFKEADRLGLGVDMATGTGWPFGGPWVSDVDACKNIFHTVYELKGGQSLKEKIQFTQPAFLRAVGSQVYEVHDHAAAEGRVVAGTRKEPLQKYDPKNIKIELLKQPISANNDLQSLALDQVQFERPLPLLQLIAYGPDHQVMNLTKSVDTDGNLAWTAPEGDWKLYALFQGWHGKMVERAAPGGEGNVIDHFSSDALSHYLAAFDSALDGTDLKSLRSFFNDSYEVDDARGAADWTPTILEAFNKKRGYDLLEHLPALFGEVDGNESEQVLYDYRITVHELLLENFTRHWADWAHSKGKIVRNQAHGAPANILDLYATVDIPETEGIEPLRIKMATSAGHVTGKKLISSESATWLDEHFLSGLGDIKANVDRYLVNGVNHIFYHGTNYSPQDEPWPGWLFYAAVHLNQRNPQWHDFAALNRYIARCQGLLQQGTPDNDILLYYPIADRLSERGPEMVEHFDSPVNAFKGTAFIKAADTLLALGYSFDFISDHQLQQLEKKNNGVHTKDGIAYKTIVVPQCRFIPIETMRKLTKLIDEDVNVIFFEGMPGSTPGFANEEANHEEFLRYIQDLAKVPVATESNLTELLGDADAAREPMVDQGISYTRRVLENGHTLYFIVNATTDLFEGWLQLGREAGSIVLMDPMTGKTGNGNIKSSGDRSAVFIQLLPGASLILQLEGIAGSNFDFPSADANGSVTVLNSGWTLEFVNGGPVLPSKVNIDTLRDWTSIPGLESFSGTAAYSVTFKRPSASAGEWMIRMPGLNGTATVRMNGDSIATLIGPSSEARFNDNFLAESNTLRIEVSNLMANRIADMDRRGIAWKKFYNVNFPARKTENRRNGIFYSGDWQPLVSGLKSPVTIAPFAPLNTHD
jgi:hypothetical protein